MATCSSQVVGVRGAALALFEITLTQGLVNPTQCMANIIALETDKEYQVS